MLSQEVLIAIVDCSMAMPVSVPNTSFSHHESRSLYRFALEYDTIWLLANENPR